MKDIIGQLSIWDYIQNNSPKEDVEIDGAVSFEEARLVLVCRKLYAQDLEKEKFTDKSLLGFYENDPVHRMYTTEIVAVYENK